MIIIGQPFPQEILPRISMRRRGFGIQWIQRWYVEAAFKDAFADLLWANPIVQTVEDEQVKDGIWMVRATTGAVDDADPTLKVTTEWEVDHLDDQISLWNMAEIQRITAKFASAEGLRNFTIDVKKWVDGSIFVDNPSITLATIIASAAAATTPPLTTLEQSTLTAFVNNMTAGVDSKLANRAILRRIRIINTGYELAASLTGVDRMWTPSLLFATESVPAETQIELPVDGYWLKRHPLKRRLTDGRRQLSEEWWHFDFYSQFVYGVPLT